MPPGQAKAFLAPNGGTSAARRTGIDDITREVVLSWATSEGQCKKLNQETLSSENMQNLKASMEHLNQLPVRWRQFLEEVGWSHSNKRIPQ